MRSHRKNRIAIGLLTLVFGLCAVTALTDPAQADDNKERIWKMDWGTFKLADRIKEKAAKGEKLVFRMSFIDPGVSVVAGDIRQGIQDAAKEFDVDAEMVGPVGGGTEKQIAELESLIGSDVDGLGVAGAVEDSMVVIINKAIEAGIPVVTFNCDNPGSKRLAAFHQTYEEGGRLSGELFLKHYKGPGGKIALLSCIPEGEWAIGRFNGFKQVLDTSGKKFEYLGPFNTSLADDQAYAVVETVVNSNPDLDGIYNNDQFCAPTGTFIERNDLKGKYVAIGMNLGRNILEHIKKGNLQGAVGQNLYQQGFLPINVLYEFIVSGITVSPPIQQVGGEKVDSSNIDKYLK